MVDFTGGTWRSLIDGSEVSAIPDSVVDQSFAWYDFSEEDGELPVVDRSENDNYDEFNLTDGGYSGVNVTINGVQAGEFDGVDDILETSVVSEGQPNTIHFVIDAPSQSSNKYIFDSGGANHQIRILSSDEIDIQGDLDGGDITDSPSVITCVFDGDNSEIHQDGVTVASGSIASDSMGDTTTLMARPGNDYVDGILGETIIFPDRDDNRQSDVEGYLANKWGISLS